MARKKDSQPKQAPPPPHGSPAQPPPDNPLLRHSADEEDQNTRELALQRLKALEQMKQAERGQE